MEAGIGFAGSVCLKKLSGIHEMSKKHANNYIALKKLHKKLLAKQIKADPSEQLFEDDPKAVEEVEYGKIKKRYTHIETKSVLDEF
tara:strand:+ start:192 stop:449 length:258 start_codon:yes stop_codon:yes gene_type:complete